MKFVELATKSLRTIGAVGQGVPVSDNDIQVAFEACQDMFDAWAAIRVTIYQTLKKVFPLVANQGGPDTPYTVGLGGDFNIQRPTWIPEANLFVQTTNPGFRIPLAILTPDQYARISIQSLSSALAQALYFDGKFDTSGPDVGLGQIFLYPVPNGQQPCSLELYLPTPMQGFADMATTDYTFPPGYAEALRYQLAKRLASEFQRPLSAETADLCVSTWAVIERNNVPVPVMRSDWGVPGANQYTGLFNWRTGCGGGRG